MHKTNLYFIQRSWEINAFRRNTRSENLFYIAKNQIIKFFFVLYLLLTLHIDLFCLWFSLVCVHIWVDLHACVSMEVRVDLWCFDLRSHPHFPFLRQVFYITWRSVRLGWMASESQRSFCPCFLSTGITNVTTASGCWGPTQAPTLSTAHTSLSKLPPWLPLFSSWSSGPLGVTGKKHNHFKQQCHATD